MRWQSACSRPAATSPSTTARAARSSRSRRSARRSSTRRRRSRDRDIVFSTVSASDDLIAVTTGPDGVLERRNEARSSLIDCSTRLRGSARAESAKRRARRGTAMLSAPVSGNAKVGRGRHAHDRRLGPARRVRNRPSPISRRSGRVSPMSARASSRAWSRSATTSCSASSPSALPRSRCSQKSAACRACASSSS